MKISDKLANNGALLVGTEALDLYLKEIDWNLRTMMGQADVLETAIIEMKQTVHSGVEQKLTLR